VPAADDFNTVQVSREENRIDILFQYRNANRDECAVILENKVDSGDRAGQIQRYVEHMLQSEYTIDHIYALYLTPWGDSPSPQSTGKYAGRVQNVSYEREVSEWLSACQKLQMAKGTLDNIRIYKEAVEYMGIEAKNQKVAAEGVFQQHIEPQSAMDVLNASQRWCQYEFLKALQKQMKLNAKSRSMVLTDDPENSAIEGARTDEEFGFSFKISERISYGIWFNWEKDYFLYTGLFDRTGEPDEAIRKAITAARKRAKIQSKYSDNHWYIWLPTNETSTVGSFQKTKETTVASSEIWRGWAKDYVEAFLEDYERMAALVTN